MGNQKITVIEKEFQTRREQKRTEEEEEEEDDSVTDGVGVHDSEWNLLALVLG